MKKYFQKLSNLKFFPNFLKISENGKKGITVLGTTAMCVGLCYASIDKVPAGHVGIIETVNGEVKPYLFDPEMMCVHKPYFETMIRFRLIPTKKKKIGTAILIQR